MSERTQQDAEVVRCPVCQDDHDWRRHPRCYPAYLERELSRILAENERLRAGLQPALAEIGRLEQEVERLREALRFYADPDNYHYQPFINDDGEHSVRALTRADDDGGANARQALSPTEEP